MTTLRTRTYTNFMLTIIALLLLALAVKPHSIATATAFAQDGNRPTDPGDAATQAVADATIEVAKATQDISTAIEESAASQRAIAKAIGALAAVSQ